MMKSNYKKIGDHIRLVDERNAGGDKPTTFSDVKTANCSVPIFSNGVTDDGLYGYTNKANYPKNSITISARGTIGFSVLRNYDSILRLIYNKIEIHRTENSKLSQIKDLLLSKLATIEN